MADPRYLYGLLQKRGYSPVAAAGILGNLKAESNLNPGIVGDKGTSFGLAQWHNDRWKALNNYASGQGLSPSSPEAQIGYLDYELRNKEQKAYQGLQSAKTPQEAAAAMIHFERPAGYNPNNPLGAMHADKRVNNALNMYSMLNGQQGSPPPMDTSPGNMAPQGFTPNPSPSAPGQPMLVGSPMPDTSGGAVGDPMAQQQPDYMAQIGKMMGGFGGGGGGGGGEAPLRPAEFNHFALTGRPKELAMQALNAQTPGPIQMVPYGGQKMPMRRRGLLG